MTWSKVTNADSVPQVGDHFVYGDYDGPLERHKWGDACDQPIVYDCPFTWDQSFVSRFNLAAILQLKGNDCVTVVWKRDSTGAHQIPQAR
jgi:hypothetical protein